MRQPRRLYSPTYLPQRTTTLQAGIVWGTGPTVRQPLESATGKLGHALLNCPFGPSTAKALSCLPSPAASCRSQHLLDCVVLCSPSSGNCHILCEQPARTVNTMQKDRRLAPQTPFWNFLGQGIKDPGQCPTWCLLVRTSHSCQNISMATWVPNWKRHL